MVGPSGVEPTGTRGPEALHRLCGLPGPAREGPPSPRRARGQHSPGHTGACRRGPACPEYPEAFAYGVPLSSSMPIHSPQRATPGLVVPEGQGPPAAVPKGASFSRGGVAPLTVSVLFLPCKPRTPLQVWARERSEETGSSRVRGSTLCSNIRMNPNFSSPVKFGHRGKAFTSGNPKSLARRGLFDREPHLAWDLTW